MCHVSGSFIGSALALPTLPLLDFTLCCSCPTGQKKKSGPIQQPQLLKYKLLKRDADVFCWKLPVVSKRGGRGGSAGVPQVLMALLGASANLHLHLSLICKNELLLLHGENILQQAESSTFCRMYWIASSFIYLFYFIFLLQHVIFILAQAIFQDGVPLQLPPPVLSEYGKDTTTLFLKYLVGLLLNLAPISLQQTFCIQTRLPLLFFLFFLQDFNCEISWN